MNFRSNFSIILLSIIVVSCSSKSKERSDEIYSRHLQKHISLQIISTPPPKDKSNFNLLLLNGSSATEQLNFKKLLDSLQRKKLIQPLIIVDIHPFDSNQEYGVSDAPNKAANYATAGKYGDFIVNELLPFVKKKAGVRKFNSVTIAGAGNAGISALDIGWDNWQKFNKAGYLFNDANFKTDFSILAEKIASSRKRPKLQIWINQLEDFKNQETKDSTSVQSLLTVLQNKKIPGVTTAGIESDRERIITSWEIFTQFLIWMNSSY